MKKLKQLIAIAITLTMLITSVPLSTSAETDIKPFEDSDIQITNTTDEFSGYGTGDLSLETEKHDNPTIISSVEDYLEIKNKNTDNKKDVAATGAASLPSSVDNSLSPYFPEIGSQGTLGSCVPFACGYYQFTYEINRARNVTTTNDNTFSPKWLFNLLNHGTNAGTNFELLYGLLKQHGCATLKSVPYDAKDYLSWCTDEKIWREAMRYRLSDYQLFDEIGKDGKDITSVDDPDLLAIKTAINNGDMLTFSTYITSIEKGKKKLKSHPDAPENDKYPNELYLKCLPTAEGGHRMAIVGYNDNLWCDINDNGKIDSGEMGAFKVANSWGKTYANKGFLWFSYDSLNTVSCVEGVVDPEKRTRACLEISRIDVTVNEGNDIYAKLTVNTANRSKFYTIFSASVHGSEYSRYLLEDAKGFGNSDNYAFDGTTTACDATFLYPLNDLYPDLTPNNFEDNDFSITIKDTVSDSSTVIVKNVSLVNEYTGKEYKVNANYPITLNKSDWNSTLKEKTRNSVVVYYAGFDEPNLHYKKSGSSSFSKVKMQENDERHGYLYKYVLENTNSDVAIYFSDDSGKIDNNSGSNYTAKVGLNYYFTEGQRDKLEITDLKVKNGIPDIGKRCHLDITTTGGYEPYQYKYTIEDLTTGETKTVNYNIPYKNDPFKYEKETKYKITVEAMDYAKQTAQSSIIVEVTDHPLEIASLSPDKENGLVSKELTFTSTTAFEGLMSGPHKPQSRFVIKDSAGKVWFDGIVGYKTADYADCSTDTVYSFTPQKSGDYTLTVSLTDWNKEYTEKTINFKVFDMIYGDADGNGAVNILDATITQKYLANLLDEGAVYSNLADCDTTQGITIMDATTIQLYLAHSDNSAKAGQPVEYTPPTPTEPPTTTPTTSNTNKVTFTNSLNWSGTIYCYYWSSSNTSMISWPGKAMTKSGSNEYSQTLYTFDVPSSANYLIFTNGTDQTVDISYAGGNVKYYALSTKTGNSYNVETWQ